MSSYQTISVEELDIGNGLFVTTKDVKSSLCVSKIVIVNTVVCRSEGQMITTGITINK
jgi:hypothetical protein